MRVDTTHYDNGVERRDACDQRWFDFLHQCELLPILLPNNLTTVTQYITKFDIDGILLTGGNSPVLYGGYAPERDKVEDFLIAWAIQNSLPLLGVCRGMQSVQMAFGQQLETVSGHISEHMRVLVNGEHRDVNSYHNLASYHVSSPLICWSKSEDGVVKAITHQSASIHGIMWHPERNKSFDLQDIALFKKVFML